MRLTRRGILDERSIDHDSNYFSFVSYCNVSIVLLTQIRRVESPARSVTINRDIAYICCYVIEVPSIIEIDGLPYFGCLGSILVWCDIIYDMQDVQRAETRTARII